jgi:hypothetical protein
MRARPQCGDVMDHIVESCRRSFVTCGRNTGFPGLGMSLQRSQDASSGGIGGGIRGQLRSARDEARLQGPQVPTVEATGDGDRQKRRHHRRRKHYRVLRNRRGDDDHPDESGADRITQPIERHVNQRLRRALLRCRHRRKEQLVTGTEPGAPEDRFPASGDDQAAETGCDQADGTPRQQRERWRARGKRQPEALEDRAAGKRLQDQGDGAGAGIVQGEKPQQPVSGAERLDRVRLEHVIKHRGARRPEKH